MAQNYYQKEIETMPIEEMKKLQSEKLVKQVYLCFYYFVFLEELL